jgi:hypothetical protein
MPFHKAFDKSRTCQYLGEDLAYEYFISNEGNFASHDGASFETLRQEQQISLPITKVLILPTH